MAILIEKRKGTAFVIGVNQKGELGLGDTNQRKTFCVQDSLKGASLKQTAIGKSGFVVVVSN